MTGETFSISISDMTLEVDDQSPAQYVCGLTGTIAIEDGKQSWTDEYFPVVDLALRLVSLRSLGEAFSFDSMCMEESPAVQVRVEGSVSTMQVFDGTRFTAATQAVVKGLESFVRLVDAALIEHSPYSLAELYEAVRPFRA